MNITETLATQTTINMIPNSDPVIYDLDNLMITGTTLTSKYYRELANSFSSSAIDDLKSKIDNSSEEEYD